MKRRKNREEQRSDGGNVELPPADLLRRRRADRRAEKSRMYLRAVRKLASFALTKTNLEQMARKKANNMTCCSCWMCVGRQAQPATGERSETDRSWHS